MIHVIVPSYDCPEYLERCMRYLTCQDLPLNEYRAVVIDDASPDPRHGQVMHQWCNRYGWKTITNSVNRCAPYTIMQGIEESGAGPDDIIFLLDGDDCVPSDGLAVITEIYAEAPETLLTYGQFWPDPYTGTETLASEYPTLVRRRRDFRTQDTNRFNHPITFRRRLWDALDPADLQDDNGEWFRAAYDVAIIIPMLEMAGPDRYVFNDRSAYIYNATNPASEWLTKAEAGNEVHRIVRSRPKKDLLP